MSGENQAFRVRCWGVRRCMSCRFNYEESMMLVGRADRYKNAGGLGRRPAFW